jgi:hypothetical protein
MAAVTIDLIMTEAIPCNDGRYVKFAGDHQVTVVSDSRKAVEFLKKVHQNTKVPMGEIGATQSMTMCDYHPDFRLRVVCGKTQQTNNNEAMIKLVRGIHPALPPETIEVLIRRGPVWIWIMSMKEASEESIVAIKKHDIRTAMNLVINANNAAYGQQINILVKAAKCRRCLTWNGMGGEVCFLFFLSSMIFLHEKLVLDIVFVVNIYVLFSQHD